MSVSDDIHSFLMKSATSFRWKGDFVLEGKNEYIERFSIGAVGATGAAINGEFGSPLIVNIKGFRHIYENGTQHEFRLTDSTGKVVFSVAAGQTASFSVPWSVPSHLQWSVGGSTGEAKVVFATDFIVYPKNSIVRCAIDGSLYRAVQTVFGTEPRQDGSGWAAITMPLRIEGGTF